MKEKKAGGRPTKTETQKRKYQLNLKLTTSEHLMLKVSAKTAGVTLAECARQAITKGVIRQRFTPETLALIRQLCGMANNLNQIARKANSAGYRDSRSEYLTLANRIDNLLNELEK